MVRITRFLYIHILLVPMLILSFILKSQSTFFICFGVVLIHELFHLFAALFCSVRVKSIVILPFGMTLRLGEDLCRYPKKEALIAFFGPFSNVLMLMAAHIFLKRGAATMNLLVFTASNWAVLLLNLVPVPPLDGGRILKAFLTSRMGVFESGRLLYKISRVFVLVVCVLGLFTVVLSKGNPSLAVVGAFLIYSLTEEKKSSDLLFASQLLYEKEKFREKNLIPTKSLTIRLTSPARSVIKKLSMSCFYVVYIVDENLKIIKTATESDFIRAVKSRGYRVTAADLV